MLGLSYSKSAWQGVVTIKDSDVSLKRMAMCPRTALHGLQSASRPLPNTASDKICEVDCAHLAEGKDRHAEGV